MTPDAAAPWPPPPPITDGYRPAPDASRLDMLDDGDAWPESMAPGGPPGATGGHLPPAGPGGRWLSVEQAAALLGISTPTVRRRIKQGGPPFTLRDGSAWPVVSERIGRPQGSAFVVKLPAWLEEDSTEESPDKPPDDGVTSSGMDASSQASSEPAAPLTDMAHASRSSGDGFVARGSSRIGRGLRRWLWERDEGICRICGEEVPFGPEMHIDHIIPIFRGGCDHPENLRTTCEPCNLARTADNHRHTRHICRTCDLLRDVSAMPADASGEVYELLADQLVRTDEQLGLLQVKVGATLLRLDASREERDALVAELARVREEQGGAEAAWDATRHDLDVTLRNEQDRRLATEAALLALMAREDALVSRERDVAAREARASSPSLAWLAWWRRLLGRG